MPTTTDTTGTTTDTTNQTAQHAAVEAEANDPLQRARDTLHAVVEVLRGVQAMRFDRTHLALREAMRQTALAAIEDALTDLYEAQRRR